jgi:hypothetical protein
MKKLIHPWQTIEPPKDGTVIVAIGRLIWTDEWSTYVDRFLAEIRWEKDSSRYEGWHYSHSGMTVARQLDDEVMVDCWAHTPK